MPTQTAVHICRFLALVSIFSQVLPVLASDSDQVLLLNGDHITGRILMSSDQTVAIITDFAGTLNIHRSAIKEIIQAREKNLEAADQQAQRQITPKCTDNSVPVPNAWAFSLQGTPDKVVLGTQSQEQFGAGIDLHFCERSPRNTTELLGKGNHSKAYKEHSTSIQTDTAGADIEQRHFFHNPNGAAVFGVGQLFTNNSLGMAMQKSAGVGILSPQFNYGGVYFDFAADGRYINEHLDHSNLSITLGASRLKEQVHYNGGSFTWNEQAWVMPAFNNRHALQAYASLSPSITLKPWLHFGLTEEESYLGNAPHPNRKNYFSSTLSLTIQSSGQIK